MNFTEQEIQNIQELYLSQELSVSKIATTINCSEYAVTKILKSNNINIRDNNYYKNKYVNDKYFDLIDTEEKAYILGFIYADGYITKNIFGIKLQSSDIDLLERIKKEIESEHHIGVYIGNNGFSNNCEYCSLTINNKNLVASLISNGVLYNKSKILKFPTTVPDHLIRHFIRGYFDGDGSVYISKSHLNISFTGTYDMLDKILEELKVTINTKTSVYKYKNKDIYDLKIGGSKQIEKIYKYFYEDATIFLDRKKKVFEKIILV